MASIRSMSIDSSPRALDSEVLELLRSGFLHEPGDLLAVELIRAREHVNGFGHLALRDDELIGVLTGHHRAPSTVFLVYLTVTKAYRRRGVARRLLEPFTGQHLALHVARANQAAQALYRSGGLRQTQHATDLHDAWTGDWCGGPDHPEQAEPQKIEASYVEAVAAP